MLGLASLLNYVVDREARKVQSLADHNPFIIGVVIVIFALSVPMCTPLAQQQDWTFEDDFSSRRGGWPTGTSDRGDEFGYVDGKYRVLIKVTEGQVAAGQIAGIPLGRRFQSLTVDSDATQRIGPPTVLHGIGCGTSSAELYFFVINLDRTYAIIREDSATGSADLLTTGRTSVAFRSTDEPNRIGIRCTGGQNEALLSLSVNGATVAEVRGKSGASFDRTMFVVTTLNAVANSTQSDGLDAGTQDVGSPANFQAEILFDDFAVVGAP